MFKLEKFYFDDIFQLAKRWQKGITLEGSYVEKQ